MAKKKSKKAKKAKSANVTHIYYECRGTACVAVKALANVGFDDSVVVLSAIGTDVTLDFTAFNGSPFKGRKKVISIKAGKSKHMMVDKGVLAGTYTYKVSCAACPGPRPPGNPQMIVP